MPRVITFDFETEAIKPQPDYPPRPVGIALKFDDETPIYYSFNHKHGQEADWVAYITWNDAAEYVRDLFKMDCLFLGHNTKFDVNVAMKWFTAVCPNHLGDTMIAAFIANPYQESLGLKGIAAELLGMPPDEQDEVGQWLCNNVYPNGKQLSMNPKSKNYFGAYISEAPGHLVGKYACGDVERTYKLYMHLWPHLEKHELLSSYDREMRLMPILIENERQGMRVNSDAMYSDMEAATNGLAMLDEAIGNRLARPGLNMNSTSDLFEALASNNLLDSTKLLKTPTGKVSMSKDSIERAIIQPWGALRTYRQQLNTVTNTFLSNWYCISSVSGDVLRTVWNQVKSYDATAHRGTVTGRFSSQPSFLNIPKTAEVFKDLDMLSRFIGFELPPIPRMRKYVVPWDSDHVLIDRDYSQQEVRILAHYCRGVLLDNYTKDNWFDMHEWTQALLRTDYGIELERKPAKILNFRIMYGGGRRAIAQALGISEQAAAGLRNAVFGIIPELAKLYETMEARSVQNRHITTWGGRHYYAPSDGAYKLVDYLIQGSAADCTKNAWINYGGATPFCRPYLSVHDEFLVSVRKDYMHREMARLKEAMASSVFDVPMLSEGKYSFDNWADMKPYDKKGALLADLPA